MNEVKKISVKNTQESIVIDTDLLSVVNVNDYVCEFYQDGKDNFKCSKALSELKLPPHFFQISRSTIINIHKIEKINWHKREVLLKSQKTFQGSVRRFHQLKAFLKENGVVFV